MQQKYQYMVLTLDETEYAVPAEFSLVRELNTMARQGWRLMFVIKDTLHYFEREYEPPLKHVPSPKAVPIEDALQENGEEWTSPLSMDEVGVQ